MQSEFNKIKDIVENVFDIEDLLKKDRAHPIPTARAVFSKIMSDRGYGITPISKFLNYHHATIVHYLKHIDVYISHNEIVRGKYHDVLRCVDENTVNIIEEDDTTVLKSQIITLKKENKKLNLKNTMLKNDVLKKIDEYFLSIKNRYSINDLARIESFKTWDDKQKINEMLRIDSSLYATLGSDSTEKERNEVRKNSKKIYGYIKKIDPLFGNALIQAMDL